MDARSRGGGSFVEIDGARGEGGGQVLRSALSLSLVTGRPFRIQGIRAGRPKPGLKRQHLAAVLAAQRVGAARVEGADLESSELVFEPGATQPGTHRFVVGTAGSACLVLQTVLPALWSAEAPSTLVIEGGTHNPLAPTFEFLRDAFLPVLRRMGPDVRVELARHGFFPAGGGRIVVDLRPAPLAPIELLERGAFVGGRVRALVAHLPRIIAERELALVRRRLRWAESDVEVVEVTDSAGPGNVVTVEIRHEGVTEVVTATGERGLRAESVAERASGAARRYLASTAPVGEHLADQLILPFAMAGGGRFRALPLTQHARTNLDTVRAFLDVPIGTSDADDGTTVAFG